MIAQETRLNLIIAAQGSVVKARARQELRGLVITAENAAALAARQEI